MITGVDMLKYHVKWYKTYIWHLTSVFSFPFKETLYMFNVCSDFGVGIQIIPVKLILVQYLQNKNPPCIVELCIAS